MNRRDAIKLMAVGATSLAAVAEHAAAQSPPTPAAAPPAPAGPFTLPALGYAFDALEPHVDAQTMQIHHDKHHAAYVNNLNKAVAGRKEVEGWSLEQLVRDLAKVPEDIRGAVRNHGGGHHNHSLFWTSLRKGGPAKPAGELLGALDRGFGGFDAFQAKFDAAAMSVFGSGWAWLVSDTKGTVRIVTTPNQDSPLTAGDVPLLGLDVWEHAYYLKYQNRRADYVAAFRNVVDWDAVSERYRARH
ncbi:MAG: superoxide dismutase [Candidatus Eisenbacteria bacterium]